MTVTVVKNVWAADAGDVGAVGGAVPFASVVPSFLQLWHGNNYLRLPLGSWSSGVATKLLTLTPLRGGVF